MAEEYDVEETTEQESPTVEENQEESFEADTGENQEQTPDEEEESLSETEDKNWRQVRERLKELELENKRLKGTDQSPFETAKKSEVVTPFLTQQDLNSLQFDEFKAQQSIPELDPTSDSYNKLFDNAVAGQYTAELNAYARGLVSGSARPLPSATQIARELKKEWDSLLKSSGAKVKTETLKKAQENLAKKEATVEAEGRSDKRQPSRNQLDNLKSRSRHGDADAIAERLKLSGL